MRKDGDLDVGGTNGGEILNEKGKIIVNFYSLRNDYVSIHIFVWHTCCRNNTYNVY